VSIGINRYADTRIPPLQCAVADARVFHAAIASTFDQREMTAILLTDQDATLRRIRIELGDQIAREAKESDLVIVFFAGHGSPESSDDVDGVTRYLVTHDTDYSHVFSTALDMERDFVRLLQRIRSRHVVVFLDSCFSGATGGRTFEGPLLSGLSRPTRSPSVSLKDMEVGEGRVILSACDDWQVAREDPVLGHGVFTHALMDALTQANSEASISINALYDQVAAAVTTRTSGQQHPILNGRARLLRLPLLRRAGPQARCASV
jgi:uncharacterized caspase-like protein